MLSWRWVMVGLTLAVLGAGCTDVERRSPSAPPGATATGLAGSPSGEATERVRLTAEQVVDDPAAVLTGYAERPGHPHVAAALWRLCSSIDRCTRSQTALVVTDDGWRTHQVLDLPTHGPGSIAWMSGHSFVVRTPSGRSVWLVTSDGTECRLTRASAPGPLKAAEVLLRWHFGFSALDPASCATHPLSTPTQVLDLVQDGDRLWGIAAPPSAVVWSLDRGRTWERGQLPEPIGGDGPLWLTPLVTGTDLVLLESADGATLTPYVAAHRTRDPASGWVSVPGPTDPTAYVGRVAVLPDGRLVLGVESWSDQVGFRKVVTPPGIWISTDPSWTGFERLPAGYPFADPTPGMPDVLSLTATSIGARVIAVGPDRDGAYVSTDLGRHWRRLAAR